MRQFKKLRYTEVTLKNNSKGNDEATAASETIGRRGAKLDQHPYLPDLTAIKVFSGCLLEIL
jgi:hypothetical protein